VGDRLALSCGEVGQQGRLDAEMGAGTRRRLDDQLLEDGELVG
jgi:hypothetical protein